MNMVRSMLIEKKFPKNFWPKAVNWLVHVLNRSPTLAVRNITPKEAWSQIKPSVSYFKIFGCTAYVHIPDNKRTKLDDRSLKCVFLGVSGESKAYRLFDPLSKTIIISRDVRFEEEGSWDWDNSYEEAILVDLEWSDSNTAATNAEEPTDTNAEEIKLHAEESYIIRPHAQVETAIRPHADEAATILDVNTEGNESAATESTATVENHSTNSEEGRIRRPLGWMQDYISSEGLSEEDDYAFLALYASSDPLSYAEAVKSEKWQKAMEAEIDAIERNNTWELTRLPEGGKKVGVKWIFKTKFKEDGEVDKHKASLMAKGTCSNME
jgi:hypothetical protein